VTFHCAVTEDACVRKKSAALDSILRACRLNHMSSANIHVDAARLSALSLAQLMEGHELMKLGDLLNFCAGLVAGAIMLAASAQAAPVVPLSGQAANVPAAAKVEPAVVSQNEVDRVKPVQVRWHHHHHWHHHHWHHRHWRHHWHHRHWHRHW
jgi:hypothetical protein